MFIDKELPVSCSHVTDYFFFNSMVTGHIKPIAPHHTTVLTASVKKNSTTRSFTHVISVRLSKNLAKDGTLAKSGRFTLSKSEISASFYRTHCKGGRLGVGFCELTVSKGFYWLKSIKSTEKLEGGNE